MSIREVNENAQTVKEGIVKSANAARTVPTGR